ncbi:YcaO-like family protein [Agrobacterium larrymoorei]|uniref:YcaO-like family protein n=1 Tax=Agrobacterium larrymoorei TaxID=160699 RepID=UPI0015737A91|nr:YcaO-like family protein [Agrobacterium larrymoorei]NTJ44222.1 YcaO-like family protein [Agrobacterium larrymoorei]
MERICSPSETLKRVSPFFKQLGITRLARQTGLDEIGIPVWCAFTPNAKSIVIAQGKGLDDEAAKASAAMEAIERAVATNPRCKLLTSTALALADQGQRFDRLDSLLALGAKPVEPAEPVTWALARDLRTDDQVWLPFDAIHLDRTRTSPRYWISSDGLASGNTLDEALLHGLLERIERDALTLWQMTPADRRYARRIDTDGISDASLRDALGRIDHAGLDIALFDITSDIQVPCVVALLGPAKRSGKENIRYVDVTLGAGASTLPSIAAMRAVTEAVQSRMTFIAGARDDLRPDIFDHKADMGTLAALDAVSTSSLTALPSIPAQSTRSAIDHVLGRMEMAGIDQIYAVDMTPDWLPVSVTKVIAPQLENPDGERQRRYGSRALSKAF